MSEPSDGIDASLTDFEPQATTILGFSTIDASNLQPRPLSHLRRRRSSGGSGGSGTSRSSRASLAPDPDLDPQASDSASARGFSPPAWRRLGNGDRSSGFWRGPREPLAAVVLRREPSTDLDDIDEDNGKGGGGVDHDHDCDDDDDGASDLVLNRAIHTKLPLGSQSPSKGISLSPGPARAEDTVTVPEVPPSDDDKRLPVSPSPDNYIRFALRADVQHRTEPLEAAINFFRHHYRSLTSTWSSTFLSIVFGLLTLSVIQSLFQPPARRPVGDLVKVAGIARSFEPLIYYSENAVSQSHDLQSTSVAVWDLCESVRISGMRDADSIVSDLDALSETMKALSLEMTKFFARVDGDIDGVLNVMDWARMHLNRLNSRPPPSTISAAYDNIHNLLSQAHILEDSHGSPTVLGSIAAHAFGPSNPQREQRMVQRLFTEFLTVLEDSVESELRHSVSLFALFEVVDAHFLNLARTVAREDEAQEEMHADLLASMWTRILGSNAAGLRKFEKNRLLLRDVRDKTVRNKAFLVEHNAKLLTLKASLEGLRKKLVSPLLRAVNSSTLTLDDQIRGLADVSEHLASVRRQQRAKVWEALFATDPSKRLALSRDHPAIGGRL